MDATWWRGMALVAALLAAGTAHAQPDPIRETVRLEGATLRIGPGESYILDGNASILGPGRVEVFGVLEMRGNPQAPGLVDVPVTLFPGSMASFRGVRFAPENGTAVDARSAAVSLSDVRFDTARFGLRATGDTHLVGERVDFAALDEAGLVLADNSTVSLRASRFAGTALGLATTSRGELALADIVFRDNARHLDARPPFDAPWIATLSNVTFGAPTTGSDVASATFVGGPNATLAMERTRVQGAAIGLRLEGAMSVEGRNDTFVGNGIGVVVDGPRVHLVRAAFDRNQRDFDGAITLEDASFLDAEPQVTPIPPEGLAVATVEPAFPWPVAITAGALAVGVGVAFLFRRRIADLVALARSRGELRDAARGRVVSALAGASGMEAADVAKRAQVSTPVAESLLKELAVDGQIIERESVGDEPAVYVLTPPPAPPESEPADIGEPLRPQERRIIKDIVEHPGTPQAAVAERLGLSRQALHYHVKKLYARGLLSKQTRGRETLCFVRPEAHVLLAQTPATESPETPGS